MKLLNPRYLGSIARCNFGCGALIGYEPEDVSENQNITCPQCGARLWVPMNVTYDGLVKEEEHEEENANEQPE